MENLTLASVPCEGCFVKKKKKERKKRKIPGSLLHSFDYRNMF